MPKTAETRLTLWTLMLGNFIIGTGVLLPAGLLNDMSSDFGITAATAGLLMLAGGLVVAVGAPVLAGMTSAIDRRSLLTFALMVYAAGHAAAALAPSFPLQVLIRAVTVVGAAIFTPQAAATAGLLVSPEKRAGAIAFIFIGWSAASVLGIPLGSYLASILGWRSVFGGMAVLCLAAALVVRQRVPHGLYVTPLSLAAWMQALTSPLILTVLLVTLLSMAGQFTVFSYLAAILREAYAGGPEHISAAFAVAGITGVAGNTVASRIVGRIGISEVIAVAISCLILGFALFASSFGSYTLALCGIGLWGLGSFSSNSLQQSRLVAIAPHLASATVALNTSVVYAGQSAGAAAGGLFMRNGISPAIAWCACLFTVAALAASLIAARLAARTRTSP